jgi:hypothetical protein
MGCRYHRGRLGPGEQFMGGNEAFAPFQVFLTVVGDPLGELVGMGQKKVDVRSARAAVSTAAVASRAARFSVLAPPSLRLPTASSTLVVLLACPIWRCPFHEQRFFMSVVYGQWQGMSRLLQPRGRCQKNNRRISTHNPTNGERIARNS